MANYLTFDDGPMVGVGNMMMVGRTVSDANMMDDFEGTVVRSRPLSDGGWWASRMDSDDLLMLLSICIFLMDGWRQQ